MIDSTRKLLTVAVVLSAVFVATVFIVGGLDSAYLLRDVSLLALNILPLLALRRNPVAVVLVLSVAYPLWLFAGHQSHLFQSLPTLVALYAAGAWARPLWWRAIALLAPVWMMTAVLTGVWPDVDPILIGYVAIMFLLAWALGVVVSANRAYAGRLEEKTAALAAVQRELADRAVADERARIARELHDVIAHAMSVITVRAGVGAHLIESKPAAAGQALTVIERTGREALAELRRMLAVLRDPDPRGPRPDPQPGLGELPGLVAQVEAAGVAVTVTTEGAGPVLGAGLDLAAYRIVQEALTNVVKHAPGARASVAVRRRPGELTIEVRNPADPVDPVGAVTRGQGMRGMAERVALYDGEFEAGPDADGFRVYARFPVPDREGEPA